MISWPWDSIVEGYDEETGFPIYDRAYRAEQLREIILRVFSEGVFAETPEAFVVRANGMGVKISKGTCHIRGDIGLEDEETTLLIAPSSSQNRIDTIVLRWDNNIDARHIILDVKQGTPAKNPQRPSLTRIESVWELGLADIYVTAGASSIASNKITDTRLETERCGIVTPFTTIDTTSFFQQIRNSINENIFDIDIVIRELMAQTERAKELADSLIDETFAGQVMDALEKLARKHILYTSIDDDATDAIDDNNGNKILGDVHFQIGGSGGLDYEIATNEDIDALFTR